jgi:hypothetical protein
VTIPGPAIRAVRGWLWLSLARPKKSRFNPTLTHFGSRCQTANKTSDVASYIEEINYISSQFETGCEVNDYEGNEYDVNTYEVQVNSMIKRTMLKNNITN